MNLRDHAQNELQLAGLFDGDSDYNGGLGAAVMQLMDVFVEQGHSGGSGPLVAELFYKLATYRPLGPITGADDEWFEHDDGSFQNKRCSALFKGDEARPYYLDAIVWRTPNGATYTGPAENGNQRINSRQFVKAFPFTPKTFYVDVLEEEIAPDDFKHTVKDPAQLVPVFEYYG